MAKYHAHFLVSIEAEHAVDASAKAEAMEREWQARERELPGPVAGVMLKSVESAKAKA